MPFFSFKLLRRHIFILLAVFSLLLSACATTGKKAPFTTMMKTTDGVFIVQLSVTPDQQGSNTITVNLTRKKSGTASTNEHVQILTTMLDMDMGTNSLDLITDGKGGYKGQGQLGMKGHWSIRVLVHTPDNYTHTATTHLIISA